MSVFLDDSWPEAPQVFPPHNPDFPDVNPATGDERETTDP